MDGTEAEARARTWAVAKPTALGFRNVRSCKGRKSQRASCYYSSPHLRVSGSVPRAGVSVAVTEEAWLDREWSSNYLAGDAQGWD